MPFLGMKFMANKCWKNENWGLRGYILSEPEANTQPIYEMYSPLLNDRFYVWSWEEDKCK